MKKLMCRTAVHDKTIPVIFNDRIVVATGTRYHKGSENDDLTMNTSFSMKLNKRLVNTLGISQETLKEIPNMLTISRVFLIPIFAVSFMMEKRIPSFWIFVVAALTDYLDGYLARKLNVSSRFGAFLDPVADKLMVSTALVLLTSSFGSLTVQQTQQMGSLALCNTILGTLWFSGPVAAIMGREIAVSALREWMAETGNRATVKVGPLGKVKTVLQMVSIALLLLVYPTSSGLASAGSSIANICGLGRCFSLSHGIVMSVGVTTLYASSILALISGLQYFQAAWPSFSDSESGNKAQSVDTDNSETANG